MIRLHLIYESHNFTILINTQPEYCVQSKGIASMAWRRLQKKGHCWLRQCFYFRLIRKSNSHLKWSIEIKKSVCTKAAKRDNFDFISHTHTRSEAEIWYLLEDADHGCGRAHMQGEWRGQNVLVLYATCVKLRPELHLQQAVVFLTELVLRHTGLKLNTNV